MAEILRIASIGCIILAVVFAVLSVALFFAFDIRNVYWEVKGGNPDVMRKKKKNKTKPQQETTLHQKDVSSNLDEAVTTLENGEICNDSLVECYDSETQLAATEIEELTGSSDAGVFQQVDDDSLTMPEVLAPTAHQEKRAASAIPVSSMDFDDGEGLTAVEEDQLESQTDPTEEFVLVRDILLADLKNSLDHLI